MKYYIRRFFAKWMSKEISAIGVIEIILILVIIIGLVLIFKEEITGIINKALETITGDSDTIIGAE